MNLLICCKSFQIYGVRNKTKRTVRNWDPRSDNEIFVLHKRSIFEPEKFFLMLTQQEIYVWHCN